MAVVGRGCSQILATILLILIHEARNAPVTEGGTSQALQLAESTGDGRGCYYNFEHYDEGDRIVTNEPCLNCTCHNKMLMCYLRVCPFTKAIGQDCTVEKKPDQCCPIITCPQVPVALLTSSTTSETPPTTTALGRPDNYGCILEDNTFYTDGAQVPSDPKKPCELCYCIRNHTACVMQECTLNVEGCKPVYQEGVCCPVRYDCDYDEVPTTPKPVGLVTTPGGSSDCLHNGQTYHDGEMVTKDEKAPCEHCYCMRGDIVCAVQECGTPLEGRDCTPMERTPGQCCPNYHCANGTQGPVSVLTSTETLPDTVKEDSVEAEKHDSEESSSESDNSSEESQEISESKPPSSSDKEVESHLNQEHQSTEAPEEAQFSEGSTETEVSHEPTEMPDQTEISTETIKLEENVPPTQQPSDSHSEASQHEESEAPVPPETVKDPEVTNEIPTLPSHEHSAVTTHEPPVEAARVPGEGSCLVEGKTYAHNTVVPTENPCQEVCRCFSSIVSCKPRDCPPAPSPDENCIPISTPGSCCPTYMCDQKTSDAPEAQDHKIDHIHHEESSQFHQSTQPPTFEEPPATEAPAIVGIPPESLVPGINESIHGATDSSKEESNKPQNEISPNSPDSQQSVEENSQLNAHDVNGHDASLHGDQLENIESHGNVNAQLPVNDISTMPPTSEVTTAESESGGDVNIVNHHPDLSGSQTDQIVEGSQDSITPISEPTDVIHDAEKQESVNEEGELEEHHNEMATMDNISHGSEHSEGSEAPEQSPEDHFESTSNPGVDSSGETHAFEAMSTDAPNLDESYHENTEKTEVVTEESQANLEESNSDSLSHEEIITNVQQIENQQETGLHNIEPEGSFAATTLSTLSQDIHDGKNEFSTQPQKLSPTELPEHIPTEKPEEHSSESEIHDETVITTVGPIEIQAGEFTETPTENKDHTSETDKKDEVPKNDDQTDKSSTEQPEENQSETTVQSISQEDHKSELAEILPESDGVHQDSVPESSHHSVETVETIENNAPHGQESTNNLKEDEPSPTVSQSIIDDQSVTTMPSIIQEEVNTDNASEQSQSEPEKTADDSTNNAGMPEVSEPQTVPNENADEHKQDESSSHPTTTEEAPVKPAENFESSHDELSTIIYEEVKVSGMPSIESHVTEGNLDHSVGDHHEVETTTQGHRENIGMDIPGPEGIQVGSEPEINEDINKANQEAETEENNQTDPVGNNEENKTHQENSESETKPVPSEIINEINEEKESLNQITSDNTAHLIEDINQIIQNEINNQKYPGTQIIEQSAIDESQQHLVEQASESHSSNEESLPETTVTPPAEEGAHKDVPEETIDLSEAAVTENSGTMEKEPSETLHEEAHNEANVNENTESVTTSMTHESDSGQAVPDEEKQVYQEQEENQHHEEIGQVSEHELPTESSHSDHHEGNVDSQQTGSTSEVTENPPVSDDHPESEVQNKDDINEISTEYSQDKFSEEQKPVEEQSSTAGSLPGISSNNESEPSSTATEENEQRPVVSGDQNVISEDVTHVVSGPSQVPDSANQVLEASGDYENVPSTEQTILEPENGSVGDLSETINQGERDQDSSGDMTHQQGVVVPSEENTESEEKHEQITESEHQEINPHVEETGTQPTSDSQQNKPEHNAQENFVGAEDLPAEHQENINQETMLEQVTEVNHVEVTAANQHDTETEEDTDPVHGTKDPEEHKTESEQHDIVSEHQEPASEETTSENEEAITVHQDPISEHQDPSVSENQDTGSVHQEPASEHQESVSEHQEPVSEHQEPVSEHQEPVSEHQEQVSEHQEPVSEHQEPVSEHQETVSEHQEPVLEQQEPVSEHQDPVSEHQEPGSEHHEPGSEHHEPASEHQESEPEHQESVSEHQDTLSEHQDPVSEHQETVSEHQETISEHQEPESEHQGSISEEQGQVTESQETLSEHQETVTGHQESESGHHGSEHEPAPEHQGPVSSNQDGEITSVSIHEDLVTEHEEIVSENQELSSEHHEPVLSNQDGESSAAENTEIDKEAVTPVSEIPTPDVPVGQVSVEGEDTQKQDISLEHHVEEEQGTHESEASTTALPVISISESAATSSEPEHSPGDSQQPEISSTVAQNIVHSTETANLIEIPSSTHKPLEEPSPMFPTWSQKPFEQHTTPEPHPAEENPYPTGFDPEYEDEDGASYGPGTCRYGGKVYLSAQQIPRDDPCDFCFCFRSDIICLQQSCPPPIRGCYQETIKGFCCPRYECHVSMATMLNITTTTTTTTTTLPPHFFAHAYNGAATKAGCQVKGVAYHVGERIPSTSGPCLECRCGANGQMKCDPTVCGPQEALLRQVMDAAVNRKRR